MILCSFLSLYNRDGVESIGLDNAASRLGFQMNIYCYMCSFHLLIVSDSLEIVAGVERRRIYDIVNVLESIGVRFLIPSFFLSPWVEWATLFSLFCDFSIQVLSRKAKNQYSWKGFAEIPKALEKLKVFSFFMPLFYFCPSCIID